MKEGEPMVGTPFFMIIKQCKKGTCKKQIP